MVTKTTSESRPCCNVNTRSENRRRKHNVVTTLSDVATKIQPKPNVFITSCASWEVNKRIIINIKKKQLFPAIKKLIKHDAWIFVQDSTPSHRSNLVQDFLEKSFERGFVKCVDWPPSSPGAYPLHYLFWDLVKTKVCQGRAGEPFSSEEQLKTKTKAVWKDSATDLKPLRKVIKQFVYRLQAVEEKQGYCIKMIFG